MPPLPPEGADPPQERPFGATTTGSTQARHEDEARCRLAIHEHELLRRIGRGAYGEVWLARNALGAYRAVKVVYRKDFEESRPFEREFSGIQKFEPISRSHEGLVNILQAGRRDDYFYYVMELADNAGESPNDERRNPNVSSFDIRHWDLYAPLTLREELRAHGHLPASRCLEIGLALSSALAHLHKHGLVHRDIKPSNIILVRRKPKLADIGLVTDAGDSKSIVGTEGYLPPEGPGTPRADIFSLGKVLYEISTGQDRRQFPDLPPNLKEWPDREAALELNEIVVKACAQDSGRRYAGAEAMLAELRLLQSGSSVRQRRAIQGWFSVAKKVGLAAGPAALLAAVVFLKPGSSDRYVHSSVPGVSQLVEEGYHFAKRRTPENLSNALNSFKAATEKDAHCVPAYFGLFYTRVLQGGADHDSLPGIPRALREAATNLQRRFPHYSDAHPASAMVEWVDWQFPEAVAEARLATQMRAASKIGEASAHSYYGFFLLQTGKPDEALEQYRIAAELHSESAVVHHHLGHPYFVKRDFEQALVHYRKSLSLEDRQWPAHYFIAKVYEEQTNFVEAIRELEAGDRAAGSLDARKQDFYDALRKAVGQDRVNGYWNERLLLELKERKPNPYYLATLYARLGQTNEAYAKLREACEKRSFDQGLMFDLCWNQQDSNFVAIAKSIRLIE